MADQPANPLTPKPLPAVQRLSRAVLVVAAGLVTVTLLAVAFLATPRPLPHPPPIARPPGAAEPGFLQRPPASPPPERPELTEQEYLRRLERGPQPGAGGLGGAGGAEGRGRPWGAGGPEEGGAAGGGGAAGAAGANGAAGAGDAYALGGDGALAAGRRQGSGAGLDLNPPAPPPRDLRRDAFLRALRAPLAQAVPAAPRRTTVTASPWLQLPALSSPSSPETMGVDDAGGGAEQAVPGEPLVEAPPAGPPPAARGTEPAARAPLGPWGTAARVTGTGGQAATKAGAWPAAAPATAAPAADRRGNGAAVAAPGTADGSRSRAAARGVLPAGTVIPALLLTEVNSDLPGPLMAQVSRDVYDLQQRAVVLARGTRLLGRYDNQVAVGQRRLLVAWTRMQLLDGTLIELPGLPGADPGGAAGLPARVQNHLLRVFGDAVLLSLLSVGADLSQPPSRSLTLTPSAGSVAAAAAGQELADAGTQLLRRDLSIQPTLRLPAGTPLTVFVNADLAVAPPLGLAPGPGGALGGGRP